MTTRFKKSRADYPAGILAIYDNRGRTIDRYCVVFAPYQADGRLWFTALHMSANPFHPQGVGMTDSHNVRPTRLPGDRVVGFDTLPADCRQAVEEYLRA